MSEELIFAKKIAEAALEKKASSLSLYNLKGKSDLCDYQLVCSGESTRQAQAIAGEIDRVARKTLGRRPIATEGMQSGQWIVLDFGSVMVHVFEAPVRSYYALDQLWESAPLISI